MEPQLHCLFDKNLYLQHVCYLGSSCVSNVSIRDYNSSAYAQNLGQEVAELCKNLVDRMLPLIF